MNQFWVRIVLFLIVSAVALNGLLIGIELWEVARTGMCPPLDVVAAYPCSVSDYLTQEMWKNEWLGIGIVLTTLVCWCISLPLLVALSIRDQTRLRHRTLLDWAVMIGCLLISGCLIALLLSAVLWRRS